MVLRGAESPCKCIKVIHVDSIIGSNKKQSHLALQTVISCLECRDLSSLCQGQKNTLSFPPPLPLH